MNIKDRIITWNQTSFNNSIHHNGTSIIVNNTNFDYLCNENILALQENDNIFTNVQEYVHVIQPMLPIQATRLPSPRYKKKKKKGDFNRMIILAVL